MKDLEEKGKKTYTVNDLSNVEFTKNGSANDKERYVRKKYCEIYVYRIFTNDSHNFTHIYINEFNIILFHLSNVNRSAALNFASQHAMAPGFGGKWGSECFKLVKLGSRFSLPILLQRDSLKIIEIKYMILVLISNETILTEDY